MKMIRTMLLEGYISFKVRRNHKSRTVLTDSLSHRFADFLEGSHGRFLIFGGVASRTDLALDLGRIRATDECKIGRVLLGAT